MNAIPGILYSDAVHSSALYSGSCDDSPCRSNDLHFHEVDPLVVIHPVRLELTSPETVSYVTELCLTYTFRLSIPLDKGHVVGLVKAGRTS